MQKKAIIFDLDNTIYPVHAIGHRLFHSLFELIERDGNHAATLQEITDDIMRRPFQLVARDYHFNDALLQSGMAHLKTLNFEGKIEPFPDYHFTKEWNVDKFLVTTGFAKLQHSKIQAMGIAADFKEIHVVDPSESSRTKKDVFADLMQRHGYKKSELLVVGDDLQSEIKAARDLDVEAILYDHDDAATDMLPVARIRSFAELKNYF